MHAFSIHPILYTITISTFVENTNAKTEPALDWSFECDPIKGYVRC